MEFIKMLSNKVWIIMLVLSLLFLAWTIPLLLLSGGQDVLEQGLNLAGSTMNIDVLDKAALGFMNMSMLKPVWEEVWIGSWAGTGGGSSRALPRKAFYTGRDSDGNLVALCESCGTPAIYCRSCSGRVRAAVLPGAG